MTGRQIVFGFLLVDFMALNAWAVGSDGWAVLTNVVANPTAITMLVDLLMALAFMGWTLHRVAKERGGASTWWGVAPMLLGSGAALLFLARGGEIEIPST